MRVALVYLGRRGGGAAYSRLMGAALARRCEVLSVVSAQAENVAEWRAAGHELLEVPTYTTLAEAAVSLLDVRRHLRLRDRLRAYSPDVIYYPMGHLWLPLLNALLPAIPKVLTVHDPVLHLGERNPVANLLQQVTVRQSTRVIVLSRHGASLTTTLGIPATSVDIVPHGEFSFYQSVGEPAGARAAPRDGDTLLFFGRISRYKGIEVLLEAFREIEARRPSTRLLVVGCGDLSAHSRALEASPAITTVNRWIPDREVHAFFARSDLVVLPYVDGSQSGVIPIAYAYGLPVVASDVGGLADQVVHGTTGLLVPAGDSHALASACLELLGSPRLRAAMGRNAAEKARLEWSWDAAAARVLESLEAAASSPGRVSRATST